MPFENGKWRPFTDDEKKLYRPDIFNKGMYDKPAGPPAPDPADEPNWFEKLWNARPDPAYDDYQAPPMGEMIPVPDTPSVQAPPVEEDSGNSFLNALKNFGSKLWFMRNDLEDPAPPPKAAEIQQSPGGADWGEKFRSNIHAGIGNTEQSLGGILKRFGADTAGGQFTDAGKQKFEDYNIPYGQEFTASSLLDPNYYATTIAQQLPAQIGLMGAGIGGAVLGGEIAAAAGFGTFGRYVAGTLGANLFATPGEAALEAGDTYNQAMDKVNQGKMTQQDANKATDSVLWKNLGLLGATNTAEFAAAFLPGKPAQTIAGQILKSGSKVLGAAAIEGGQEGVQDIFQRQAFNEPIAWDARMKESVALGAAFGGGIGAAGVANDFNNNHYVSIKNRTIEKLPDHLKNVFDQTVEAAKQAGLNDEQAREIGLDAVADHPDGPAIIDESVNEARRSVDNAATTSAPANVSKDTIGQPAAQPGGTQVPNQGNVPSGFEVFNNAPFEQTHTDPQTQKPVQVVQGPDGQYWYRDQDGTQHGSTGIHHPEQAKAFVPAAKAAQAPKAPAAAAPKDNDFGKSVKVGDRVTITGKTEEFEVVDVADRSQVKVKNSKGTVIPVGRVHLQPPVNVAANEADVATVANQVADQQKQAANAPTEAEIQDAAVAAGNNVKSPDVRTIRPGMPQENRPEAFVPKTVPGTGKTVKHKSEKTKAGVDRIVVALEHDEYKNFIINFDSKGKVTSYHATKKGVRGQFHHDSTPFLGFDVTGLNKEEISKALNGQDYSRTEENPEYQKWLSDSLSKTDLAPHKVLQDLKNEVKTNWNPTHVMPDGTQVMAREVDTPKGPVMAYTMDGQTKFGGGLTPKDTFEGKPIESRKEDPKPVEYADTSVPPEKAVWYSGTIVLTYALNGRFELIAEDNNGNVMLENVSTGKRHTIEKKSISAYQRQDGKFQRIEWPLPETETAEMGKRFDRTMYRGTGKSRSEIYEWAEVPIAGQGEYWAFTEEDAKNYGDNVKKGRPNIHKAYVINNDQDWIKLTKEAGWKYPNPYGADPETIAHDTAALRDMLVAQKYGGLIIQMDTKGDNSKLLRDVFGHDQAVSYDLTKKDTKPKAAATEEPKAATDEDKHKADFLALEPGDQVKYKLTLMDEPAITTVTKAAGTNGYIDTQDGRLYSNSVLEMYKKKSDKPAKKAAEPKKLIEEPVFEVGDTVTWFDQSATDSEKNEWKYGKVQSISENKGAVFGHYVVDIDPKFLKKGKKKQETTDTVMFNNPTIQKGTEPTQDPFNGIRKGDMVRFDRPEYNEYIIGRVQYASFRLGDSGLQDSPFVSIHVDKGAPGSNFSIAPNIEDGVVKVDPDAKPGSYELDAAPKAAASIDATTDLRNNDVVRIKTDKSNTAYRVFQVYDNTALVINQETPGKSKSVPRAELEVVERLAPVNVEDVKVGDKIRVIQSRFSHKGEVSGWVENDAWVYGEYIGGDSKRHIDGAAYHYTKEGELYFHPNISGVHQGDIISREAAPEDFGTDFQKGQTVEFDGKKWSVLAQVREFVVAEELNKNGSPKKNPSRKAIPVAELKGEVKPAGSEVSIHDKVKLKGTRQTYAVSSYVDEYHVMIKGADGKTKKVRRDALEVLEKWSVLNPNAPLAMDTKVTVNAAGQQVDGRISAVLKDGYQVDYSVDGQKFSETVDKAAVDKEAKTVTVPEKEAAREEFAATPIEQVENVPKEYLKKLFFSVGNDRREIDIVKQVKPQNILLSFARWETPVTDRESKQKRSFESFIDNLGYNPTIILDSGAYSFSDNEDVGLYDIVEMYATSEEELSPQQAAVQVEYDIYNVPMEDGEEHAPFHRFYEFVQNHGKQVDYVVAMDVIRDPEISLFAYEMMKGIGVKLIPTFHYGSEMKHLDELVRAGADYIGLGGSVIDPETKRPMAAAKRVAWVKPILEKYPDVKFHLFGTSNFNVIDELPGLYSADSSTWAQKPATADQSKPEVMADTMKKKDEHVKAKQAAVIPDGIRERINWFGKKLRSGDFTADEVRAQYDWLMNNKQRIIDDTFKHISQMDEHKRKRVTTRQEMAAKAWQRSVQALGTAAADSYMWQMGQDRMEAIGDIVKKLTDADIKAYFEKKAAEKAKDQKILDNPETLSELRQKKALTGSLTDEEQARLDELEALDRKERKQEQDVQKRTVGSLGDYEFEIKTSKHEKKGTDQWIVSLVGDRLSKEEWTQLDQKMRKLGAFYYGKKKGFIFTQDPTELLQAAKEGPIVGEDKSAGKGKAVADRLRATADKMQDSIDNLRRDRLTNTTKRAGEAASALNEADRLQRYQKIMRNLADAIESGEATHLDGVSARTHIELLDRLIRSRVYDNMRRDGERTSDGNGNSVSREPKLEDINGMEYPKPSVHKETAAEWVEVLKLAKIPGTLRIADQLQRQVDRVKKDDWLVDLTPVYDEMVKLAGILKNVPDSKAKVERPGRYTPNLHDIAEQLNDRLTTTKRLHAMGIETAEEFRAALREYLKFRQGTGLSEEERKKREMKQREQDTVFQKIPGYFPTPKPIIDRMLEEAQIEDGMKILEPSAGKGNIADAIREEHPDTEVEVAEYNSTLQQILRDKGYHILGTDFMELPTGFMGPYDRIIMNPPFENGQDVEHVLRAFDLLKPGGRLIAIVSEGPFFRPGAKYEGFRELVDQVGWSEKLPEGSFKSAERSTGVATRLVVMDFPAEEAAAAEPENQKKYYVIAQSGHISAVTATKEEVYKHWTDGITYLFHGTHEEAMIFRDQQQGNPHRDFMAIPRAGEGSLIVKRGDRVLRHLGSTKGFVEETVDSISHAKKEVNGVPSGAIYPLDYETNQPIKWIDKPAAAEPAATPKLAETITGKDLPDQSAISDYLNDTDQEMDAWGKPDDAKFKLQTIKLGDLEKAKVRPLALPSVDAEMQGQSQTDFPIVVDSDYSVIDGMHRLADILQNGINYDRPIQVYVRQETAAAPEQFQVGDKVTHKNYDGEYTVTAYNKKMNSYSVEKESQGSTHRFNAMPESLTKAEPAATPKADKGDYVRTNLGVNKVVRIYPNKYGIELENGETMSIPKDSVQEAIKRTVWTRDSVEAELRKSPAYVKWADEKSVYRENPEYSGMGGYYSKQLNDEGNNGYVVAVTEDGYTSRQLDHEPDEQVISWAKSQKPGSDVIIIRNGAFPTTTVYDKNGKVISGEGQPASKEQPVQEKKSQVEKVTGKEAVVKTERGTEIKTRYAIVDAADLIASHDDSFRPNPEFPKELQPRDRSRAASEDQINRMAANLEPSFLGQSPKASEGAPIVGPDMVVESGNGRVLALKRAYANDTNDNYLAWLTQYAESFGIQSNVLFDEPVLVRIRETEMSLAERKEFVKEANEQSVAAMSATEQAAVDAEKLSGSLMASFAPDQDGNVLTAPNREFIRNFMDQVVGAAERSRYMNSEGALNQDGVRRIQNAVFAKAYGDISVIEKLAESTDNNVKNITTAMLIAAPKLAKMKEGIAKGSLYPLDLTKDIADAVNKLSALRDAGTPVSEYLIQMNLFGDDLTTEGKDLLAFFDAQKRSRKKLTSVLTAYPDIVEAAGDPNQLGLFEKMVPTKSEVLDAALRKVEQDGEGQVTLWESPGAGGNGTAASTPETGSEKESGAAKNEGDRGREKVDEGWQSLGSSPKSTKQQDQEAIDDIFEMKGAVAGAGGTKNFLTAKAAKEIQDLVANAMDTVIRPGRTQSRKSEGEFSPHYMTGRVKKRSSHNERVVLHELGHRFSKLGFKGDAKELTDLANSLYPVPIKDPKLAIEEGTAELFQLWIRDRAEAIKRAPKSVKAFEEFIAQDARLNDAFHEARTIVENDLLGTPLERTMRNIVYPEDTKKYTYASGEEYEMNWFQRLVARVWDFRIPFVDMDKAAEAAGHVGVKLHHLLAAAGGARERARQTFERRATDHLGRYVSSRSLQSIAKEAIEIIEKKLKGSGTKFQNDDGKVVGGYHLLSAIMAARLYKMRYEQGGFKINPVDYENSVATWEQAEKQFGKELTALVELYGKTLSDIVLDKLLRANVITEKTKQILVKKYDWYLPTIAAHQEKKSTGVNDGGRTSKSPVKRYQQGTTPVLDFMTATMLKLQEVEQAIEYKRVLDGLEDMLHVPGMGRFVIKEVRPTIAMNLNPQQILKQVDTWLNDVMGEEDAISLSAMSFMMGEPAMKYFTKGGLNEMRGELVVMNRNGDKVTFMRLAPDLFESLMAMRPLEPKAELQILAKISSYSRYFAITNFKYVWNQLWRDLLGAGIQKENSRSVLLGTFKGMLLAAGKDPKLADQYMASGAFLSSAENVLQMAKRSSLTDGMLPTEAPGWKRTVKGKFIYKSLETPGEILRWQEQIQRYPEFESVLESASKAEAERAKADATEKLQNPKKYRLTQQKIIRYQSILDHADKLAAIVRDGDLEIPYGLEKSVEMVLVQAGHAASEVSANFNLKGNSKFFREYGSLVSFFHGSMQGMYREARMFTNPKTRGKAVARTLLYTIPLSVLSWLLLKEDDDDIPSEARDRYWFFGIPGTRFRFTIAKPYAYAMTANFLERFLDDMSDTDGNARAWNDDLKKVFSHAFGVPFMPIPVEVIWDLWANKNNFGSDIVPQSQDGLTKDQQFGSSTSELSKMITRFFIEVTGDPNKGPAPSQTDYLIRGLFGGAGRVSLSLSNLFLKDQGFSAEWEEIKSDPGRWPVFGSLILGPTEGGSRIVDKFYKDLEEARSLNQTAEKWGIQYKKTGKLPPGNVTEEQIRKVYALPMMEAYSTILADMRKSAKTMEADPKVSPQVKQQARLKLQYFQKFTAGYLYGHTPDPVGVDLSDAEIQKYKNYLRGKGSTALQKEQDKAGGPTFHAKLLELMYQMKKN